MRAKAAGTLEEFPSSGRGRPKLPPDDGDRSIAFKGKWPKIKMRLTPLDVLGQRGKSGLPKGW